MPRHFIGLLFIMCLFATLKRLLPTLSILAGYLSAVSSLTAIIMVQLGNNCTPTYDTKNTGHVMKGNTYSC